MRFDRLSVQLQRCHGSPSPVEGDVQLVIDSNAQKGCKIDEHAAGALVDLHDLTFQHGWQVVPRPPGDKCSPAVCRRPAVEELLVDSVTQGISLQPAEGAGLRTVWHIQ